MRNLVVGWFNIEELCAKFNCTKDDLVIIADKGTRGFYKHENISNVYYLTDINNIEEYKGIIIGMKNKDFDIIISNPPYGKIGAEITRNIIDNINYKEFINLEPGNDYFINNNYKNIDINTPPVVLPNGAFEDANQSTVISKIVKEENNLTVAEARVYLSIKQDDKDIYNAIKELIINTNNTGFLKFSQKSDIIYNNKLFVFNPGAFDICHGYFAVYNDKKKDWTSSTYYNIFHESALNHKNLPTAEVKGITQFKKLIYSEQGLKLLKLLFSSSPEGWGFAGSSGLFADIDYAGCSTWYDVFSNLNISENNQIILMNTATKLSLNEKEKEICQIVKSMED